MRMITEMEGDVLDEAVRFIRTRMEKGVQMSMHEYDALRAAVIVSDATFAASIRGTDA